MATIIWEPRITFIHIPKTGGNSITAWIRQHTHCGVTKKRQHADLEQVMSGNKHVLGPLKRDDLGLVFCVVRNPWDYAVSWYTFHKMLLKNRLGYVKEFPDPNTRIQPKTQDLQLSRLESAYNNYPDFEDWLQNYSRKVQHVWAKDCDLVFKLENINEDFKTIQNLVNCHKPLPLLNKTTGRKKYQEYYTSQKSIDIIAERYKIDIENYKYDF